MAIGRGGSRIKTRLGFLVYGEQGTRKSSFCLEAMKLVNEKGEPFRILYLDAEQGSVDSYIEEYEDAGYDPRNIFIIYTQSLFEVREFIRRAKDNEDFYDFDEETGEETDTVYLDADGKPFRPDMIVVDGATVLYMASQQGLVEFSKKRATVRAAKNELVGMAKEVAIEGSGLEIKDYNTLKFFGQDLILDLLASGKHFAVTCREEDEKEQYKDKSGEIKMMATGRKRPSGFRDVVYNCKTVLRLFKDTDGIYKGLIENKDRTRCHEQDTILIEPSILDWQKVITKNKGKKDFNLKNSLGKAVETERKAIEKNNAKFDVELEAEEDSADAELTTVPEYHGAIRKTISKLDSVTKAKKIAEVASSGLPKTYLKVNDVEVLKKIYSIVSAK